ncbi:MAG: F0F1 ATP synthase subunit B [Actinomycetota bacterium]
MINLWALAADAEEAGDPPNPVIPVENEIVWAAIFFFLLWGLMKFVLLPPILKAMENRATTIQSGKDAADAATAALGSARRDHEATLTEARAEANQILAGARAAADERRAALQAEADAEIAEMRRSAQAEIDEARASALSGMRGDVSSLAVGAAQIVLGRDLDAGSQQSVIDQALSAN